MNNRYRVSSIFDIRHLFLFLKLIFVLSVKFTAPLVHNSLFVPFVFAFSVPGDLHIHHITTGSGAVDGARIGGDERFAASFAESDAQVFIREHFCKTDVDSALKGSKAQTHFAAPPS